MDGIEQWWDGVEAALELDEEDFILLRGISPYGQVHVPHECLVDLASECRRLASCASSSVEALLLKIAELCDLAAAGSDAELRIEGD